MRKAGVRSIRALESDAEVRQQAGVRLSLQSRRTRNAKETCAFAQHKHMEGFLQRRCGSVDEWHLRSKTLSCVACESRSSAKAPAPAAGPIAAGRMGMNTPSCW